MGSDESDRTKKHSQEKVLRAFLDHVTGTHPAVKKPSTPPPDAAGARSSRPPPAPSPRPERSSSPPAPPAEAPRGRHPTGSAVARRASLPYAVAPPTDAGVAARRHDSGAMRRALPRDPDISRTPTEIRPSPHAGVPPVRPAGGSAAAGFAAAVVPPPLPSAPGAPSGQPIPGAVGVGTVLDGKYRLVRLLGKGGVGEVYEAIHELIGLRVAVKLIRFEYASNAELNQRFLQEARAAAAVGHPGIVQIHDVGRTPDTRTYLVMEYMEGEDLEKQLSRERRMQLDRTADVLCDVLDALGAAHAKAIIHRDMKPENVFLVPGRHGERVTKLLDFGIARLNDESQVANRLTRPGSVMGTPYYMCPEQARGDQHVDEGVDIYAVGVMLYEMLTGQLPFSGNTYNEVLSKVLVQPFPSVRSIRPDVPEAIEQIIFKATARERSARFATALEFADALAPFRSQRVPEPANGAERRSPTADTPLPTTSQASLPPPARPLEPDRPPATAAEPPAAAGGPGEAAEPSTGRPSPAAARRRPALWAGVGLVLVALAVGAVVLVLRGSGGDGGRRPGGGTPAAPQLEPAAARITVVGAPAGAELRFDGRPVGNEFEVPRSTDEHALEVAVPGGSSVVRRVRPTADLMIDVAADFEADGLGATPPQL
jgi:serine/threonine-protein kinase